MPILQVEQNTALCAACPYCGKRFDATGVEERNGQRVAVLNRKKVPEECDRCGCPMDSSKVKEFANRKAEEEAGKYGALDPMLRIARSNPVLGPEAEARLRAELRAEIEAEVTAQVKAMTVPTRDKRVRRPRVAK